MGHQRPSPKQNKGISAFSNTPPHLIFSLLFGGKPCTAAAKLFGNLIHEHSRTGAENLTFDMEGWRFAFSAYYQISCVFGLINNSKSPCLIVHLKGLGIVALAEILL